MNITKISKYLSNIRNINHVRCFASEVSKTETAEELIQNAATAIDENEDDLMQQKELEIEKKRNKSRLLPQHRNMLLGEVPYTEPQSWIHETVKYQRTMFGRYGAKSGVEPGICWPTKPELEKAKVYESYAHPHTIQEMVTIQKQKRQEDQDAIQKRQDDIVKKIAKLDQWKKELSDKIIKKETDARVAKERKDRLVEEVRRHFGFKIDARDERFKEMLEKKEKEEKKAQKEAKKKLRETKMLERLQSKDTTPIENVEKS